jgi:hypothetical protein
MPRTQAGIDAHPREEAMYPLYDLWRQFLVKNSINSYLIHAHAAAPPTRCGGQVEVYIQAAPPGADKEANRLRSGPASGISGT